MSWKFRYLSAKEKLLADASVCAANLELFREFFAYEEYKLKRQNRLPDLDEASSKTLLSYVYRFRNVNKWFNDKPWTDLTKDDIKRVYDDLEEGRILTATGKPFKDRRSYYNKVFKSKPFRLAGKAELAKEVLEFYVGAEHREVRYVTEDVFRDLVSVLSKPAHLLLFWLAWDIGENVNTLLQLTKRDFMRQRNPHTNEAEYIVNLPREKLKRSRRQRSEPTLYPETVRFLDMTLRFLREDEAVFRFEYRQALKLMQSAARKTGAACMPAGQPVTWKDLRSGMACHLLNAGWSRDEVNARLGHVPSSNVLDAYINFMALDRHEPKRRLVDNGLEKMRRALAEAGQRESVSATRLQRQAEDNARLREELELMRSEMASLWKAISSHLQNDPNDQSAFIESSQANRRYA